MKNASQTLEDAPGAAGTQLWPSASAAFVSPTSMVAPAPLIAPGTSVRVSPNTATIVPIPGLKGMKPSPPGAEAPIREPRQPEALSLTPAGFGQPARPYLGASIHAAVDRGSVADAPAPESESGTLLSGFQKVALPAREAPAGAAVTSPAASTPHPLAFAARLVEQPAAGGEDIVARVPTAQASADAAAPPLSPQPAKPEDPNSFSELPAAVPQRDDTGNSPSQPRVTRQDSAENLRAASTPVAGCEAQPTPARGAQSAPAEQGNAIDSSHAAAQALAGSAPREATVAAPAQNISVRLSSDGRPALEVRVMDRGGEVRVAVHSADPATSESVRAGLPELVDRLGQRGFETEIWRPPAAQSSSTAQGESDRSFGRGSQQDPADQQHPHRQPQPAWLEEMESNLKPNPNRSTFSWRP